MDVNINIKMDVQVLSTLDSIPKQEQLMQWASATLNNPEAELGLRIVDETEARQLNNTWRNKDYATNVLSFPVGEKLEQVPDLLGDIVICAPVVEREASEQGKETLAHWAHLLIHGILHLQGYDHQSDEEADLMETEEIRILTELGFTNPY